MDCTGFDQLLLSSQLASSLPPDTIALLSGTIDSQLYLNTLSRIAIQPEFTELIVTCYEPLFPELAARWRDFASFEEMACAFARVLPITPHLAGLAEELLVPDSKIESGFLGSTSQLSEAQVALLPATQTLEILLALWRLLVFKRESFLKLAKMENVGPLLKHPDRAVRYMAVRFLCLFLKAADSTREQMFVQYGVGNDCEEKVMGNWEGMQMDYGFLVLMEGKRLEKLAEEVQKANLHISEVASQRRVVPIEALSPLTADLCGILIPRLKGPPSTPSKIIDTPTTRANIYKTAVSLRSSSPTLITGPAGSGKTFLVHQIAHTLNTFTNLISIHLGDQTDAKLLVGAYTTADTPGSFEWRPGVLTTAVKEGRWVLVEDIDKAPTEVLSVLLPLMERGELVIPSRGETIVAARGFRLIATMRTSSSTQKQDSLDILGSRLWNRVNFSVPDKSELHTIITARFPLLTAVARSLLEVYTTVQNLYREPSFFALSKTSLGRQISPRDLIKWSTRIEALFVSTGSTGETIPDGLYNEIFMEAVDCFAGSLQTVDARYLVIRKIAEGMMIPSQRVELFLNGHIPGYHVTDKALTIGRAKLKKRKRSKRMQIQKRPFATTNHALRLLEQVGVGVRGGEPILLVGETGTGKTTVVQQMADMLGYNLTVMNLSQQTESGDLLGGYKPVDVRTLAVPLKEVFEEIFEKTFSLKRNKRFLEVLSKCWSKQQWNRVITLWGEAVKMAEQFFATPTLEAQEAEDQPKKKRKLDIMDKPALQAKWTQFASDIATLERQSSQVSKSFAFSFVEGSLVKAARNGDWVLLDEINLAAPDTLESIADLLKDEKDGDLRSILLSEKGDVERVKAHPDFRIFACMNPATDVGKRDLPSGLRSRFTELYVISPDQDLGNLLAIVREYLGQLIAGDERAVADVAGLYLEAKKLSEAQKLVDGANQRPHFSMRTLTRTLSYVVEIAGVYGLRRSLYEGFCMSFLTLLDRTSEGILLPVIEKFILGNQKNVRSLISQIPRKPVAVNGEDYVQFEHYWMARGTQEVEEQPQYIITPFVKRNMLNLVRATATRRFPVLIQGPTSSGKTSMIEYLAKRTGHKFVRINNHEHTDLQEYLGSYVSDNTGTLRFQEGILVEALRKGYWIVLDELNLAPTDVLEALNRLLDDNRELMIPETQEVVRPHKEFMLFATQNPPGLYGGRKVLSRAFRNRFLELHFDDIPEEELETILRERCGIAPSYCGRIVKVYKELSLLRQSTRLFEQKNSFATLRDLFRWANREAVGYQQLADNGYMLLAERVRKEDEKIAVKKVLEEVMKVKIDEVSLYSPESMLEYQLETGVVWTKAMRRLYSLVAYSLMNNEPVLLVGETGCGKTTVCQILAEAFGRTLQIVNAHQNTETGDIIGAQRPIRNRAAYTAQLVEDLLMVFREHLSTIESANTDLAGLLDSYAALDKQALQSIPAELRSRIESNRVRIRALFEWSDGSLIQAMKEGQFFLLDEISLADDSVLERLNSVLEPQRRILLAEKGPEESEVTAVDGFQFLATMNPGGDYGKKELSPALRNRFTEIWVPSMSDFEDVLQIVRAKLAPFALEHADTIVKFAQWFSETYHFSSSAISIRDVLAWAKFLNMCDPQNPVFGLLHGAALVFIDGLGANPSAILISTAAEDLLNEKQKCISKLSALSGYDLAPIYNQPFSLAIDNVNLQLGGFSLPRRSDSVTDVSFNLEAPTTGINAMRVVRAMQLRKPVLLEGSPGVGKTSLISALATASGNPLTRINLSEQTDLMDLFGSDVPVEGGQSGEFAWRDAPFLQAMQRGNWVLLDEMNLASQSVLEGLNACLDHRGEAYIAELDRSFKCHPNFAVFAAQNPHHQGGGRKGLPASFVNRFTVVYVDTLNLQDLQLIATRLYPNIPQDDVSKVIAFIVLLDREVSQRRSFGGLGGPWEFNLRDTLRWLGLLSSTEGLTAFQNPSEFVDIVIKQRFRTAEDRARVDELFVKVFGYAPARRHLYHQLSKEHFQVGHAIMDRYNDAQPVSPRGLALRKGNLRYLETIMTAVTQKTPVILVGPSGAGKSSIIKFLASVSGAELDEIALNSDIDTTDIVGGFEQVDISRSISGLYLELQRFLKESMIKALSGGFIPGKALFGLFDNTDPLNGKFGVERLHNLHSALKSIGTEIASGAFDRFIQQCEDLISQAHQASIARFEWVDGMLIHAIEEGKWLILDNANLCSPSVLDRLNSLLELNGYLIVNEHNDKNGEPKLVRPHPNFRLFLTMDPRHGELSRAMRNRGMEIYMDLGIMNPMALEAEIDDHERLKLAQYTASTTESSMAFYSDIERLINTNTDPAIYDNLIRIIFDHLPRDQMSILDRWKKHISTSQMSLIKLDTVIDVVNSLEHLRNYPRVGKLLEDFLGFLSQKLNLEPKFGEAQSLNPIRNTSLLSPGIKKKYDLNEVAVVLNGIYECTRGILKIKKKEEDILQRSTATRMKEMTFLEKSASKNKSSVPGFRGNIELPLFGFLTVVRQSLERWLNEESSIQTNINTIIRASEILDLWQDIFELSSTHNLNESVFHVYLTLLEDWLQSAVEVLPARLIESMEGALRNFRAPLQLTTGFSMELLWNDMRPSVPSSIHAWDAYHQLQDIADRFDTVASQFKGSFGVVGALKTSLLEALTAALTSNVEIEELVQGLDQAIAQLESSSLNQLNTSESPLKPTFDYLLKFKALKSSSTAAKRESFNDTLTLAHFAGRTTSSLLGYQGLNANLRTSYKQVLEDIYEYDASSYGPEGLLQGRFVLEILRTSQLARQSFIGQISQLNIELGVLGKQFTLLTQQVTSDQLLQLNILLLSNMKKIIELHCSSYALTTYELLISAFETLELSFNGGSSPPDGLGGLILATLNTALKVVINEHFFYVIDCLVKTSKSSSYPQSLVLSGKAWTHYALGCLKLYVPNCAFDPAMKCLVKRERYLKRKSEFRSRIEAEKTFELRFTGQEESPQTQMLEEQLNSLGEEPPNSFIVRPKESEMGPLQGDMLNLLQVVVHTNPHKRLLPSVLERKPNHKDEEILFQKNLSQIIDRLRRGYPLYKDLIDPILGFLYSLKLGLSLASMDAEESSFAASLINPSCPEGFADQIMDHRDDIKLLRLWQIAVHQNFEGYESTHKVSKRVVHSTLQSFFENWKIKIQKEQEEAATNASLYRYIGEEENAEETELAAMFPDYEQDLEEKKVPSGYEHHELACRIALCHSAIHLPMDSESTTLSSLIRRGASVLTKLIGQGDPFSISPSETETFLPAIILSLKESSEWINGATSQTYDFYTGENLEQARKLVVIVEKAHARLAHLVEAWPEHVTLQDAVETCQQLLDLPNSTPVAQFLVKVEKLHEHLNEWQGVANSEYSAAEHYDAITQLIISWRRLELSAWPRLFDIEDEKCHTEANSWWFYVYESVIANPLQLLHEGQKLGEHVEQLLTTLVSFIGSSSISQFSHRLQLLQAFEQHALRLCDDFPGMSLLQKGLHNLVVYYSQYEPMAQEAVEKSRKKYQKSMGDVVLLASWKDTNILALRDSAKRSHKKLFRVVKGYRQAINQPMSPLLQGGMPENPTENPPQNEDDIVPTTEAPINIEIVKSIYEKSLGKWTERPVRLQDLTAAVQMMERVAQIPPESAEAINFIEDFSSSIVSTIKQLQSETPGTLNEETKEISQHLKTRKRKAFADALKELKNMGLKSNLSAALLQKQATLERILVIADPLENGQVLANGRSKNNNYFLRIIESLPKIRKAVVEHSQDLTSAEVARSVGFIENLLSITLDQRNSISLALNDLEQAQSSMARYNTLANLSMENTNLYGSEDFTHYSDLRRRFQWIPRVLDVAVELLKVHSDFSGKKFEDIDEFFSSTQNAAIRINDRFSAQQRILIHKGIWENSSKLLIDEAHSTLYSMEKTMHTIRNDYPEIAYTTIQILPWVSHTTQAPQPESKGKMAEITTLGSLDSSLKILCDSIFVALQKLKEAQLAYPPSAQDPGWLLHQQSASASSLKALHISEITRRVDEVVALTSRIPNFDAPTSQAVRALFATYQPIVQEYTKICCRTVQEILSQHRSICKTTYILCTSASTLLSKGFCMPQEKGDPEGGQTNNVEGGTGLGEGEGQEDISKDIKADEDLSELAQEKDKEERKEEIEDEKDAVDIEDEMEGELGDMPDKEDEKGSEDGKDDDGIDEETGDVDDLDPNAVDEKLWDGNSDDDAREKEGEGMKDQKSVGEDMEAKKENGKEKVEDMESKEEEDGSESEGEGEGADEDDEVRQQDDKETTDTHVPEIDTLDLPENMELDADEKSGGEEDGDDMNIDDLSDVGEEGEEIKEDEKDGKQDNFPDLDAPENEVEEGESEMQDKDEGEEGKDEENGEEGLEEDKEEDKEEQRDSLLTTRDGDNAKEAEETAPSDLQGVEGGNDEQDANEQTSAQRESGEDTKSGETHGKGADEAQVQEENTGKASVQEADRSEDQPNKRDEQTEQESSFRKVGDMLEKWHQKRHQILNAKEDEERPRLENMELDDPEFEHLPNDDAEADTQALGAATEDQARSLDDSMAIDSGTQETHEVFEDMELEEGEENSDKKDNENETLPESQPLAHEDHEDQETQAGAMIGESREQRAQRQKKSGGLMDLDDESEETPTTTLINEINNEPALAEFNSTRSREEARKLWQQYEQSTKDLSMGLCEQLRLILEPTLATKMRGDFRTGKRLNMKRIIPYIASQYKKDKIWMRRTKPSKRQYQVMIAVDDSKSMAESESVALAFETVTLVAKALSQLEVGQISIVSFGEDTRLIHPFDQPFTSEAGVRVFERFSFDQLKTNVRTLLDTSMAIFESAKVNSSADLWQLEIIISDGVCEDHETLRRLVRRAQEEKIMIVFVILDSVREKSILHMKQVRFETRVDGTQELKMERYLDTFPFGFYLVVNDIRELPGVLALALRQWFAEIVDANV